MNSTDHICYLCSNLLIGCLTCANSTACSTCDEIAGYGLQQTTLTCIPCNTGLNYGDPNSNNCLLCGSNVTNCLSCSSNGSSFICDSCVNGFYVLNDSSCVPCINPCTYCSTNGTFCYNCTINYFQVGGNCLSCSTLTHCLLCTDTPFFSCLTCNNSMQYFLNPGTSLCEPCNLAGCLFCTSYSVCSNCSLSQNYFIDPLSPNLCLACSIPHCNNCSSLTVCLICDESNSYAVSAVTSQCILCNSYHSLFPSSISHQC